MSYIFKYDTIVIKNTVDEVSNSGVNMVDIPALTMNLQPGWYSIEFNPVYDVNSTNIGTGWDFGGGTAVLSNYAFRSRLPSTTTANFFNNYSSPSQNFTTTQTSRTTGNRGSLKAEFLVTTPGTLIPRFRSELPSGTVTVKVGSYINIKKLI